MRSRVPVLVFLIATATTTLARAEQPALSTTPAAPETTRVSFGWEIVAADLGTLALATAVAESTGESRLFLAYPLAAPLVHLAHRDPAGAAGSFALHLTAPVAGALVGYQLSKASCHPEDLLCGLGGMGLGLLGGLVTATVVDATFLAHVDRPVSRPARNLPTPTVALAPGGGFVLGVAGRL